MQADLQKINSKIPHISSRICAWFSAITRLTAVIQVLIVPLSSIPNYVPRPAIGPFPLRVAHDCLSSLPSHLEFQPSHHFAAYWLFTLLTPPPFHHLQPNGCHPVHPSLSLLRQVKIPHGMLGAASYSDDPDGSYCDCGATVDSRTISSEWRRTVRFVSETPFICSTSMSTAAFPICLAGCRIVVRRGRSSEASI